MRSKWLTYFGIFTFVLLGGVLVSTPTANAISDYDNAYRNVNPLLMKGGTCEPIDLSISWSELIATNSTYQGYFEQALDTGSWSVSISYYEVGATLYSTLYVYWLENDPGKVTFSGAPGDPGTQYGPTLSGQTMRYMQSTVNPSTCAPDGASFGSYSGLGPTDNVRISESTVYGAFGLWNYLVTSPVTYPDGYVGEPVESTGGSAVTSDYVPDMYVSDVLDFEATIHDRNFNTFDGIQWTCSEDGNSLIEGGDGLAPVLYWQVWRDDFPTEGTNLLIGDGYQSATAPVVVELPINRDEAREYRVAGWYECGGDVDFTDASNFNFVVNANGVLDESAALSNCISNEFPFIYLDDCIGNLAIFGKIALFGGATFDNSWTASTSCTELAVFDDWLNLDNPTVCPNFPSEVRAVVTPFVTFIFGLITMKFLATRTGKDF